MLIAQATQALEVTVRRRDHAAGTLNGLGDDSRDTVAVLGEQLSRRLDIVVGDLDHVGQQIAPARSDRLDALHARAADVHTVIAAGAPHDDLPVDIAAQLMDSPSELQHGVDGF